MNRDMIAQIIIVITVCVGGWMMLVQPPMQKISAIDAEISLSSGTSSTTNETVFQSAVQRMTTIPPRLEAIRRRNEIAGDSTSLYAQIKSLANQNHVVVRRLVGQVQSQSAGATSSVNQVNLLVEGGYEQVARFLAALDRIDGFIRAESLKLNPLQQDGQQLVTAQVSCEAHQFFVEPVAELMEGSKNAQP